MSVFVLRRGAAPAIPKIEFRVNHTVLEAYENMTWEAFCDSDMSYGLFAINEAGLVYLPSTNAVVKNTATRVEQKGTDIIVADEDYDTETD